MNLLKKFKGKLFYSSLFQIALGREVFRLAKKQLKRYLLYQKRPLTIFLKEPEVIPEKRPKILASIAHITSFEEAKNPEKAAAKIEKLRQTLDGLLTSFAHCDLTILVTTVPNRHITPYLPDYQRQCIQVQEYPECDSMFVGYQIQEQFVEHVDEFDWFLFTEDDIVLSDSLTLEKLEKFNENCGEKEALLLPHRYEMWEGTKRYIDLTLDEEIAWNKLSVVTIDGTKFAEFSNPHSGFYCLSRSPLQHWIQSGRDWKNQVLMVGPLESAATFCLLECFSLYKPHPANLNWFEIKHYDTKYSKLYPQTSPYTLSSVKNRSPKTPETEHRKVEEPSLVRNL